MSEFHGNGGNSTSGCFASVKLDQPSGSESQTFSLEGHGENTSDSSNFGVRQRDDEHVTESEVKTSDDSNATCAAGVIRGSSRSYASGEQAMTKIVQENTGDIGRVAVVARASGRNGASSAIVSQQGSMAVWKTTGSNARIMSSIGDDSFFSLRQNLKRVKDFFIDLPPISWIVSTGPDEESSVDRNKKI